MRHVQSHRRTPNPTAWAEVILASQVMEPEIAHEIMAKLHSAFLDLQAGSSDDDLFTCLGAAVNVGLVRAEQIDELCVEPMLAARDALLRSQGIRERHGRYGFDGPGLQAVKVDLEVYEEMVRNSSPVQMRAAMTESLARMRLQMKEEASHGW